MPAPGRPRRLPLPAFTARSERAVIAVWVVVGVFLQASRHGLLSVLTLSGVFHIAVWPAAVALSWLARTCLTAAAAALILWFLARALLSRGSGNT